MDQENDNAVVDDEVHDSSNDTVLDFCRTALNACSIESYLPAVQVSKSAAVVPVCLGCYELNESTGERNGRLDLYSIPVSLDHKSLLHNTPDHPFPTNNTIKADSTTFGHPLTMVGGDIHHDENIVVAPSGVLDGKWYQPTSTERSKGVQRCENFNAYYASAHANGTILIHNVVPRDETKTSESVHLPFQTTVVGKSETPSDSNALCLALAWDNKTCDDNTQHTTCDKTNSRYLNTRIVSSYSDGHVAIHRVRSTTTIPTTPSGPADEDNQPKINNDDKTTIKIPKVEVRLEHYWKAHTLFQSHPAEVWSCNFLQVGSGNLDANDASTTSTEETCIVATGGDEGTFKIWDIRTTLTTRPIFQDNDTFTAGVTVISPHPRREHIVAVGSYDESIAIYDLRKLSSSLSSSSSSSPTLLHHSTALGGGIWRCKWHPYHDNRLLLGAMHGGCRVVEYDNTIFEMNSDDDIPNDDKELLRVKQKFTMHQSMAYGADWIWYYPDTEKRSLEAAVSCSFYDRAMYLWDTL